MTISIPVPIGLESTNVVDYTEEYVPTMQRNFPDGYQLQFGNYIYQNVGDTIKIPAYNVDETYEEGDLAFKDSYIQKVVAVDELSPLQPESYSTAPDNLVYSSSSWTHRYVKLFSTFTDGANFTTGGYKHTFYDNVEDGGFIIQIVENTTTGEQYTFTINAETSITNDSQELVPEIYSAGFYKLGYVVLRGTVLYARTSVSPTAYAPEYSSVSGYGFQIVNNITDLGGFIKLKPTISYAPIDDENNTTAKKATSMTYTIKCYGDFNTLALGNIKGDSVTAVFKNSAGTTITTVSGYDIDGSRDTDDRLEHYGTTVILYSSADIGTGGTIEISISGDFIELGSIVAGLSVNAGFTDLVFSNRVKDFSPVNIDQFGKVEYISGVRVMEHSGTVRVPISRYDQTNRLISSIGGNTIILNGSDTTDNSVPDNESTFSSTMIIGRWQISELKTGIRDMDIDQLATYGFTIRERI